jgi:hypothetical protein
LEIRGSWLVIGSRITAIASVHLPDLDGLAGWQRVDGSNDHTISIHRQSDRILDIEQVLAP